MAEDGKEQTAVLFRADANGLTQLILDLSGYFAP
jgi:hypothetical protein